jgi:hypothetical protein
VRSRERSHVRSRGLAHRSVAVAVAVVVDAAAVAVVAMAAVVAAVMVVAAADAGHRISGSTKSGTRHSGPAFLLRDSVSQRERSRG